MSKDPTFRVLGQAPTRSERYQAYRHEWDRREADLDASDHPVHVDLETVAVCDLRCGSSEEDPQGFCQIWTHEHIRTQGFDEHTYQRGYMPPTASRHKAAGRTWPKISAIPSSGGRWWMSERR